MSAIHVAAWHTGLRRLPFLEELLERPVRRAFLPWIGGARRTWLGWGLKPSGRSARRLGKSKHKATITLEDGFLRSYGTGDNFPPLSLVVDDVGIYYDSTRPSALENLLNGSKDLLHGIDGDVQRARQLILEYKLSKYNHAERLSNDALLPGDGGRVLVVDQTVGDLSVALGGADASTFAEMMAAARAENPHATVYVKTHPDVSAGRKLGYLTAMKNDARTVVLRQDINPQSLLERMDRIYTVTSTMGFEALLADKPVTVFGRPWYAGWGLTDDRRHAIERRDRPRTVDELFAAAYFHYSRYLDPVTHRRGTIFNVIDWLIHQRTAASRFGEGRMLCVEYRRWKAANVRPMLSLHPDRVQFVSNLAALESLNPTQVDNLVYWGCTAPKGLEALAARCGARLLRMEDGFVRSVGLGSDLIRPLSLVLDEHGIYFDATRTSWLERYLNTTSFTRSDIARARSVRRFVIREGITKYNTESLQSVTWRDSADPDRLIVLVPGQVEDDASIRFGCVSVKTNLGLLQAARAAHPNAFIVYKPHPDVLTRNRSGSLPIATAKILADHVETDLSIVSCIHACDVVHTMTSLAGFDALLRGKRVIVHGQPFYAGWGLTEDRDPFERRRRLLTLDELVVGALLHYPLYWDWELKGFTTCEAVLQRIVDTRTSTPGCRSSNQTILRYLGRQWRKCLILVKNLVVDGNSIR